MCATDLTHVIWQHQRWRLFLKQFDSTNNCFNLRWLIHILLTIYKRNGDKNKNFVVYWIRRRPSNPRFSSSRPTAGKNLELENFHILLVIFLFINVYMVLFLVDNVIYAFLLLWLCILIVCLCMATLTEVFLWIFLSCKANARVYLAKMGHGPHSS